MEIRGKMGKEEFNERWKDLERVTKIFKEREKEFKINR